DRVTQRRARAMRLEIADFTGLDLGIVKRSLDDVSLRKRVRRGQAVTRAVLIDCRAAYHCKYPVPISLRLGQRLQDDDGRPLAAYIPVRARVERLATSVGSKHVRFTEGLTKLRRQHQIRARSECHRALAGTQAATRQMHGHER